MIQLDFKKAILLPFSGKDWILRLVVLIMLSVSGISFPNKNIHSIMIILTFLTILFLGYFSQFAHNKFNNVFPALPDWRLDFIKYFKQGLVCFIGSMIYTIIFGYGAWYIVLLAEKFNINYFENLYKIFELLSVTFVTFFVTCIFAERFKFIDMFNFKKIFRILANAKFEFILCFMFDIGLDRIIEFVSPYLKPLYIHITLISTMLAIAYIMTFDLFTQTFILSKQRYIQKEGEN